MYKGLYDCFKHWYRGGNIWLYSDPHFGDDEMKQIRNNYIEDDEQVKRINSKVGKNDTIIFLGDIGNTDYIKKIRGYKILIMGNHDMGANNYKRKKDDLGICPYCNGEQLITGYYDDFLPSCKHCGAPLFSSNATTLDNHLFDEVYEGPLMINNKIMLSHEPVNGLPFIFNIHGHEHTYTMEKDGFLNLCAEHINYTPVSLITLLKDGIASKTKDIHRITIDKATIRKRETTASE